MLKLVYQYLIEKGRERKREREREK